jgi:hypothetical protein
MAWRVYGDRFLTADFAGTPQKWQPFTLDYDHAIRVIRSWFVIYNDPVFTAIKMRIYSYKNNEPYQMLYETDVNLLKAEIHTNDHGFRNLYFEFSEAPYLKAGETYALVPWVTGYTGDADSHIAWGVNFPRLIYDHADTVTGVEDLYSCPFEFTMLGARL